MLPTPKRGSKGSQLLHSLKSLARTLLTKTLSAGPIPLHVGFIADGNRRFARQNNIPPAEAWSEGYWTLIESIDILYHLGVKTITAFLFSIENFKRPPEEIEGIMRLFIDNDTHLSACLEKYNIRLNVIGRMEMLPTQVQHTFHNLMKESRHRTGMVLNICMAYTSRDEITTALASCIDCVAKKDFAQHVDSDILPSQKAMEDIDAHLKISLTNHPPLDLIVRTGGDKRLSDFLLWQCCNDCQLQFLPTMWPAVGVFDWASVILEYQRKIWYQRNT